MSTEPLDILSAQTRARAAFMQITDGGVRRAVRTLAMVEDWDSPSVDLIDLAIALAIVVGRNERRGVAPDALAALKDIAGAALALQRWRDQAYGAAAALRELAQGTP